jgi:protein-S-isoprenylcysteine O-methyltransferase Ste14
MKKDYNVKGIEGAMPGSGLNQSGSSPFSPRRSIALLLVRLLALLVILAGVLFISAGRLDWPQAWLFILAYGVFLLIYGAWGQRNDPGQITERSNIGSNVKTWDKIILSIYTVLLFVMLIVAGLDAGQFRWAVAPTLLQAIGWVGLLLAGGLIWWAASVNTFLSRWMRIQVDRGQQAVTTGPYRWVRHPMYGGVIIYMLSIPLVLGSIWALVPGILIIILYVIRTALEDRTLREELPGYREYAERVCYRLIPGIW